MLRGGPRDDADMNWAAGLISRCTVEPYRAESRHGDRSHRLCLELDFFRGGKVIAGDLKSQSHAVGVAVRPIGNWGPPPLMMSFGG